jgi:hypothetical protein
LRSALFTGEALPWFCGGDTHSVSSLSGLDKTNTLHPDSLIAYLQSTRQYWPAHSPRLAAQAKRPVLTR